jgi:hypothetical protein
MYFNPFLFSHQYLHCVIYYIHFNTCCIQLGGPGSLVSIATAYGLDGLGIESWWGQDFLHLSIQALGPTQPPVQWVRRLSLGVESGLGMKLTPHPLLELWSKNRAAL